MLQLIKLLGTTYANTVIKEVGLYKQSLNKEDVFVLDNGLEILQINTPNCDKDEKVNLKSDIHYYLFFISCNILTAEFAIFLRKYCLNFSQLKKIYFGVKIMNNLQELWYIVMILMDL